MEWNQIWTQLQTSLAGNQFLSGGFVLMVVGAIAALARQWPSRIYNWLINRVFIELEIAMTDEAYFWLYDWVAVQPYGRKRSRSLTVRTSNRHGNASRGPREFLHEPRSSDDEKPMIILSPAPGIHWLFWRRRFVVLRRVREVSKGNDNRGATDLDKERFFLRVLTFDRNVAIQLLEEARELAYPPDDERVKIFVPAGYSNNRHWTEAQKRHPRPAGSVVLLAGLFEGLQDDIQEFHRNHHWYIERGIPYRRGYLLHGPPGNGKSSTVMSLASELHLNVCVVNLSSVSMGDEELLNLMNNMPDRSLLLIEDIDCVFQQRESKSKESKLTFSGLLNAIDGVAAPEGHILVMTTNHPELLDPALVRPGRCDVKVLIENATREQARRLFLRFFPKDTALADKFSSQVEDGVYCMAVLQNHLVCNARDAFAASVFVPPPKPEVKDEHADTGTVERAEAAA